VSTPSTLRERCHSAAASALVRAALRENAIAYKLCHLARTRLR
jgi:hypothetical protein